MAEDRTGFAAILKALRAEKGMTQTDLADRAEIGISTMRQYEYGLREPTYATLLKLARGLGVSLAAFDPEGKSRDTEAEPPKGRTRKVKKKG
jgi:transcriptional regulator with XRE-family HTH domain